MPGWRILCAAAVLCSGGIRRRPSTGRAAAAIAICLPFSIARELVIPTAVAADGFPLGAIDVVSSLGDHDICINHHSPEWYQFLSRMKGSYAKSDANKRHGIISAFIPQWLREGGLFVMRCKPYLVVLKQRQRYKLVKCFLEGTMDIPLPYHAVRLRNCECSTIARRHQ